ncbi:MAG: hypothetical protein LBU81_03155 [Methanosarcinales archaeon]|jgi:hypothetical protein|nr:hypothetical protein [Methanosarcinales archaeon]
MIARKKPIEVEFFKLPEKFMPDDEQTPEWLIEAWLNGTLNGDVEDEFGDDEHLSNVTIETLEGTMSTDIGDYIIKGVKGELYPCKPDIFEMSYDIVEESAD